MSKGSYSIVFYDGLRELEVSHAEYCFLHYVYSLTVKSTIQVCFTSKSNIAKTLNLSERTINRFIKRFYPEFIAKTSNKNLLAKPKLITHFRNYEKMAFELRKSGASNTPNLRKNSARMSYNKDLIKNNNKDLNKIKSELLDFNFSIKENELIAILNLNTTSDFDSILKGAVEEIFSKYHGRPDQREYLNTTFLLNKLIKQIK